MDTGQGGSNDNVFFENDFSHAPTNGIEATFSRNRFSATASRSAGTASGAATATTRDWSGNRFARNTEAIAIEHGQDNDHPDNVFDGDETAIRLWQNADAGSQLGISEDIATREAAATCISGNTFSGNKTALDVRAHDRAVAADATSFENVGTAA